MPAGAISMQEIASYKDAPRGPTLKVERFGKFIWIKWNGGDEEALGSSTNTWGEEKAKGEEKEEIERTRRDGVARIEADQRRSHVVWGEKEW